MAGIAVALALAGTGCAPRKSNTVEGSSVASVIVQVSSPEGQLRDLELVAEQFNYAAAMLRLFSRERDGLRAEVGTLFVPLDTALASSLASQERTLADLNSPSRYNVLLLRAHASSVRLTLTDLASAVGQKILLLSGTEVTVVTDPTSGALNLVRSDGTQVKIIANDVFTGDPVVHFVDQPVSLPFGA
ncbi:MAG: fasciclin domain-containing protein [Ilumatobacteraceae bacterium]